jgi:N-acetyl-gamma-glutamyl-phosphate reductase
LKLYLRSGVLNKIKVGILGVTGYSGIEILRLLGSHSGLEVIYAPVRKPESLTLAAAEHLNKYPKQNLSKAEDCDIIFSALPHVESLKSVLELADKVPIIDLSGDLRLKNTVVYEQYYGAKHLKPEFLEKAVYGLPEMNREKIKDSKLIANPGCYATAALLALLPLAKEKAIIGSPIIDAKSGISGAGKTPSFKNLYCEVSENMMPYSVGSHNHIPEIEQTLADASGDKTDIIFTPYLIPVDRGILCTAYMDLKDEFYDERKIRELYEDFYKDEPFVKLLEHGVYPNIKSVRGSNRCDIGIYFDKKTKKAVIFSAIDNLVKGAAGQAIQNMNLMFGFDEKEGLPVYGLLP